MKPVLIIFQKCKLYVGTLFKFGLYSWAIWKSQLKRDRSPAPSPTLSPTCSTIHMGKVPRQQRTWKKKGLRCLQNIYNRATCSSSSLGPACSIVDPFARNTTRCALPIEASTPQQHCWCSQNYGTHRRLQRDEPDKSSRFTGRSREEEIKAQVRKDQLAAESY